MIDSLPSGIRRRITLRNVSDSEAVGHVEDDIHEFSVTVRHSANIIERVSAEALRFPWTTCPGAVSAVRDLEGKPLSRRCGDVVTYLDMSTNCTHLYELAALTVAHAARAGAPRRYQAIVQDRKFKDRHQTFSRFERGEAVVLLNSVVALRWVIEEPLILEPKEFAGVQLFKGFRQWTQTQPEDVAEAALILRRAIHIAGGRAPGVEATERASQMGIPGVCYTFQPQHVIHAINTRSRRKPSSDHQPFGLPGSQNES